ncbi:hypothetical protein PFISCL1PPCAC_20606, partial [Pristionchus fissidentatus]
PKGGEISHGEEKKAQGVNLIYSFISAQKMRGRLLASSSPSAEMESMSRRVPLLPEEYERMEEKKEENGKERVSSSTSTTHSPTSSSSPAFSLFPRSSLLLLPLLLLLLFVHPTAACPDSCSCEDGGTVVKCTPGSQHDFPFLLPPTTTYLDLTGSRMEMPTWPLYSLTPNLHTLILRNSSITALNDGVFAGLPSLKKIDLAMNDIKSIHPDAFTGASGLEYLDLSSNRRLSLPLRAFDALDGLRRLDLSNCGLKELEQGILHGLERLEELNLKNNRLSFLPRGLFGQQRRLQMLDLSGNKLDTTSSLSPLPSLLVLNIAGNSIKHLDRIDHLSKLEKLDASHNLVSSLPSPPSFPPSLKFIDLSHNELRQLQTAAFDSLVDLSHLNLSHNKRLDNVQMNVFVSLTSLEYLSLAHCTQLTSFSPAAFQPLPLSLRVLHLGGIPHL